MTRLDIRRAGGGRHRRGQGRRRHRRRGPRERGRPDLRRREGHPRTRRVHGPLHVRLSLRAAGRRRLRPARPAADVRGQPGQARHRLHRHRRREGRRRNRHLGVRPRHHDAAAGRPGQRSPTTSPGPATSCRCAPRTAACCAGPATPRPPSTWPGWPVCSLPARSARSSARRTRARWPRPTSCGSSPTNTTWR